MVKQRLHLLGLPHTQTTAAYSSCAYTQKVVKFCRMMTRRGWEIILYAGEENEAPCSEHVSLISHEERIAWFGEGVFDTVLTPLSWGPLEPYWLTFNGRAIAALAGRWQKGDLILLATGTQATVAAAYPSGASCEPFVGYEGIATPFAAFESSSFMHTAYAKNGIGDGRNFDAVIPNYFDPDEFPYLNDGTGDYLLYCGRLTKRKGVRVANEIARHAGMKLVVAGPGATFVEPGKIICDRGPSKEILEGDHLEYVGPVGIEERAKLMAGARALLAPTDFLEPFGGVAVEAMLAGTPAITTDWGAFQETVEQGVTGFRFRMLRDAIAAVDRAGDLEPAAVRARAIERFSLEAVAPLFEDWFDRLGTLWHEGWYQDAVLRETVEA